MKLTLLHLSPWRRQDQLQGRYIYYKPDLDPVLEYAKSIKEVSL